MFNRLPLIIAALLVASTATAADRQDSSYIGLQANQLDLDFGQEATVSMLTASMGYRFNPYIALEVRGGLGSLDSDDINVEITDPDLGHFELEGEVSLNWLVGGYAVATLPLGPVDLYSYAGWSKAEAKLEVVDLGSVTDSDAGPGYGLGVGFRATDNLRLSAEYGRLLAGSDLDLDAATLRLDWFF